MKNAIRPVIEVLATYLAVTVGIWFVWKLQNFCRLSESVPLFVALVFLYAATRQAQNDPRGPKHFGLELGGILAPSDEAVNLSAVARNALRETGFALAVMAVVFPLYAVGFWYWHHPSRPFSFTPRDDFEMFMVSQLVLVALPEEAFFRGYVQTRFADAIRQRGWVIVLQSILFALIHMVALPYSYRLSVFFPGLLFGWIRARRGGIGAAIVVHAGCNIFSEVITRGWL